MKFVDLFKPVPLRIERIIEVPSFDLGEQNEYERGKSVSIRAKSGLALSALSAPLVPLDEPFIEGQRYRLAGATELATRVDCYLADPAGPWRRRHGVLVAVQAGAHPLGKESISTCL